MRRLTPRLTNAGNAPPALVLLPHLLLLLAALQEVIRPRLKATLEPELTLVLPPAPKPAPARRALAPSRAPAPRGITMPPAMVAPPIATPAPEIQGLGQKLFGCGLENLANLTPEQRARCGGSGIAPPDTNALTEARSHVKAPELRAAEMEQRNTPMTVPCVTIQIVPVAQNFEDRRLMVDPLCAANQLSK